MIDKDSIKAEFKVLIKEGHLLLLSMWLLDEDIEDIKDKLKKSDIEVDKLPDFKTKYQHWYTKCYYLIKLVAPERLIDFEELYKKKKGKEPSVDTYCISDALLGIRLTKGITTIAKPTSAISKMEQQLSILESIKALTENYFYNLESEIHSDVLGSEIDSAYGLFNKKFLRAAGSIAGVVLEKHLANIASQHQITISKKTPTIADFNEKFKEEGVYDVPTWRKIQYLGDIRNICCHNKKVEPTEEQVRDLLDGVKYVIQNVF